MSSVDFRARFLLFDGSIEHIDIWIDALDDGKHNLENCAEWVNNHFRDCYSHADLLKLFKIDERHPEAMVETYEGGIQVLCSGSLTSWCGHDEEWDESCSLDDKVLTGLVTKDELVSPRKLNIEPPTPNTEE